MDKEVLKKFLTETDHTGRFIVTSLRTGKKYFVEPIGTSNVKWGDINPATGKLEGNYGKKYEGSIHKKDSLITEENGFHNIVELDPGMSPAAYIEKADAKYPDKSEKA